MEKHAAGKEEAGIAIRRAVYTVPFFAAAAVMAMCYLFFPSAIDADPKTLIWMAEIRERTVLPAGFFAVVMTIYLSTLVLNLYPDPIVKIRRENTLATLLTMIAFGGVAGIFFYIYLFFPSVETVHVMS